MSTNHVSTKECASS